MRAYFKTTGDNQAQYIFEHTHTWEEVRSEAQKALDLRYRQNGKRNFFRKSIRLVGDVASRLEFLTQLIPSGDYMGVLCGGLKLIYNVRPASAVCLSHLNLDFPHNCPPCSLAILIFLLSRQRIA